MKRHCIEVAVKLLLSRVDEGTCVDVGGTVCVGVTVPLLASIVGETTMCVIGTLLMTSSFEVV